MGKRTVNVTVGAISPVVKVERILAAIFKVVNDYKLISVDVTETVLYWRYDVETRTQMNKKWKMYQIL